jgi:hypothetical protein
MSVRAVALQLEKLCKAVQEEKQGQERVVAIINASKFLTSYDTFEEAYKNETEDRWIMSTDLGEDPKRQLLVSFDTDKLDKEALDALGGETKRRN